MPPGAGTGRHQKVDLGPFLHAGIGQQFLGFVKVLGEGILAGVAQETDRDDLLHQLRIAAKQCDDLVVVDGVADGLTHIRVVQRRLGGVHAHIDQQSGQALDQAQIRIAFEGRDLLAAQILDDVGVAGLNRRLEVGHFRRVLHDHALHRRLRYRPSSRRWHPA